MTQTRAKEINKMMVETKMEEIEANIKEALLAIMLNPSFKFSYLIAQKNGKLRSLRYFKAPQLLSGNVLEEQMSLINITTLLLLEIISQGVNSGDFVLCFKLNRNGEGITITDMTEQVYKVLIDELMNDF